MSRILYDFITDSFLYSASEGMWTGYTDDELYAELMRYKEFARSHFQEILRQVAPEHPLQAFAGIQMPEIALLSHLALYLDVFFIYDPLFGFDSRRDPYSVSMTKYLGFKGHEVLDRGKLKQIMDYIKKITPFVSQDYVRLIPYSFTKDFSSGVPIAYSENYFDDLLPEDLREWFHNRAIVRTLEKSETGWIVLNSLVPSRAIAINFRGEELRRTRIYHLLEQEIVSIDKATRKVEARMYLPSIAPDRAYFDAWVHQSVNRSAHEFYTDVYNENIICTQLGNTSYLTDSGLINEFLSVHYSPKQGTPEAAANLLLNLDLPAIERIDPAKLMEIRQSATDAFERFRSSLERKVFELQSISDADLLKRKVDDFSYELTETNIRDIRTSFKSFNKLLLIDALLVSGSLTTAILAGGWGLIPSAVAAFKGIKTFEEYRSKIRTNPSYLYWRIQKYSGRSA